MYERDRVVGPVYADLVAWTDATQVATHGGHAAEGFDFVLPHDQTPVQGGQRDWRFCVKCSGLFFDGHPDKGTCSMGGEHSAAGFNFVLPHDQTPVQGGQRDWRFCVKCNALFYDGYIDNKGVCPKDGIGHEPADNNFVLPHDDTPVQGQRDWRFCVKCNALFYDGYPAFKGACSTGEGGGFHLHPVMNGQDFDPFTVEGPIDVLLEDETPTGAFSYGGRVYVFIFVGRRDLGEAHPPGSYLVSKVDPGQPGPYRKEFLLTLFEGAEKAFWQVAPWVVHNADHPGLPNAEGDGVVLFGQGWNDPRDRCCSSGLDAAERFRPAQARRNSVLHRRTRQSVGSESGSSCGAFLIAPPVHLSFSGLAGRSEALYPALFEGEQNGCD